MQTQQGKVHLRKEDAFFAGRERQKHSFDDTNTYRLTGGGNRYILQFLTQISGVLVYRNLSGIPEHYGCMVIY